MPLTPENFKRAKELHDVLYGRLGNLVDSGVAPDDPSYVKLSENYNKIRRGLDDYESSQRKVDDAGKLLSAPTETRHPSTAGPKPAKGSYNFHFEPSVAEVQNMLKADPSLAQRMGIGRVFDTAQEAKSEPVLDPTTGAPMGENVVPGKTHLDMLEAGSGDYNAAAEYLWRQRHQEAEDKGEAVQRYRDVKLNDQPLQYLTGGAEYNIERRLAPAMLGAADAYSMGQASPLLDAGRDLAEYELGKRGNDTDWLPAHSKDIQSRSPGLYIAGNMLAYGLPGNPTNLAQEGLSEAAKYTARGPIGKALVSAGTGAQVNTLEGGIRDLGHNLGEGQSPGEAAMGALHNAPENFVAGAVGGGVFDAGGQALGAIRQSFREQPKMRPLKVLTDAGGDTDPIRGVIPPREVQEFVRQGNKPGAIGSPAALAAEEVAPHIQSSLEKQAADEQGLIEQQKQEYFQHPAYSGREVSGEPAIRGLVDMAQQGWTSGPVTGAPRNVNPGQVEKLGRVIRDYTDAPQMVRRENAEAFAQQHGGIVIDGELGNKLYGLGPQDAAPPGYSIVAVPLKMNAEKLTGLETRIDDELNMAATRGSNNDPVWTNFNRSVKSMRDEFPLYQDEAGNLVPPPDWVDPNAPRPQPEGPVYDGEFVDTPRPGTDIKGPYPPSEPPSSGGGAPPNGGGGPTMPGIGPGGPRVVQPEDATPMSLMSGGQLPELPAGHVSEPPMSVQPEELMSAASEPPHQGEELLSQLSSPAFPVGSNYQDFAKQLAFLRDHPKLGNGGRQQVEELASNFDLMPNESNNIQDVLYAGNTKNPQGDRFADLMKQASASEPPMSVQPEELMSVQPEASPNALGDFPPNERIRLADVRAKLGDMPREQQDAMLKQMQRDGELVLYRNDNPRDLNAADKESAMDVGGHPRHLVYFTPKKAASADSYVREPTEPLVRPKKGPKQYQRPANMSLADELASGGEVGFELTPDIQAKVDDGTLANEAQQKEMWSRDNRTPVDDSRSPLERMLDGELEKNVGPDESLPGPHAKDWADSNNETTEWYEDLVSPGRDPRSGEAKRMGDLTNQQKALEEAQGQVRNMEDRLGPLPEADHLKSILGILSEKLGRKVTKEDLVRAGLMGAGLTAAATSDDDDDQNAGMGAMVLGGFGGRKGGRRSAPPGGPSSIMDDLKAARGPRQLEATLENGEVVKGFSALRHKQHEALSSLERSKARVGAGGDKTIRDRVIGFNQGDDLLYDKELMSEAEKIGKGRELKNAAAANVYPHLKERAWALGGEGIRRAFADTIGLRSDKVLELLSGAERNQFIRNPDTLLGQMQRAALEDPARRLLNLTGGRTGARHGDDLRAIYDALFPEVKPEDEKRKSAR